MSRAKYPFDNEFFQISPQKTFDFRATLHITLKRKKKYSGAELWFGLVEKNKKEM